MSGQLIIQTHHDHEETPFYLVLKRKGSRPKKTCLKKQPQNPPCLNIPESLISFPPDPHPPKSLLQRYRDGKPSPVYQLSDLKIKVMKGEFLYPVGCEEPQVDPTGWWLSEKLDGVRAIWTGRQLLSSQGNPLPAPKWFIRHFPQNIALDGELYLGRHQFYELMTIVKNWEGLSEEYTWSTDQSASSSRWTELRYHIFDIPDAHQLEFEEVQKILHSIQHKYIIPIPQIRIKNFRHFRELHQDWVQQGAEGSMLRQPHSYYRIGRSKIILKCKSRWENGRFINLFDDEAIIVGYKYNWQKATPTHPDPPIKSLLVRWIDHQKFPLQPRFNVSHGLTHEQKNGDYQSLFPVGQRLKVLYTELIRETQKPRFPRLGELLN